MLIGNVLQQVYNLTDAWVVGQFVGKEALAAVGASFSIVFLLVALVMGGHHGSGIMISQFYGAGDMERVRRTIPRRTGTSWSPRWSSRGSDSSSAVPSSCCCGADDVMPQAVTYLNIMFAGTVLSFGYNAVSAVLRALGDSRTPLYFLAVAVAVNVGLDLWFVIGFGWGVAGAAWATIISQGIAFAAGLVYLQRSRHEILRIRVRRMPFDRTIFAQSMRIGLPSGGQQTLVAAGFMALARIVNGFGNRRHGGLHRGRTPRPVRRHARNELRHGAHDVRGPEPRRGQAGAGAPRVPRDPPHERGVRAGRHPAHGLRQGAADQDLQHRPRRRRDRVAVPPDRGILLRAVLTMFVNGAVPRGAGDR